MIRLHQRDLSTLFTTATGGRSLSFVRKNALEQTIKMVSEEVHRQYLLSFQPRGGEAGEFYRLRVAVRNRPDVQVRTRAGYWALPY
jgi:hypothetical protein